MALRLTKKDKDKINRINQSIRRKNKQMENFGLVDFNKPIIKASEFTSRKQLNEYLSEARTYTRGYGFKYRMNQYGTVAKLSEIGKGRRLAEAVSRDRAKRFKEIAPKEFKSRGKGIGSSVMQRKLMGDDRYSMYDPVKFNFKSLRNIEQFEQRIRGLSRQLESDYIENRNTQLKNNIIKAMQDNWGKDGKKAIDYVKSLTPDEVLREFMTEDVFDFSYVYDENHTKRQIEIFEATYNL